MNEKKYSFEFTELEIILLVLALNIAKKPAEKTCGKEMPEKLIESFNKKLHQINRIDYKGV